MRDKLLSLAALQRVDLDIAALQKNAEAYPREMAELEKQLAAAKAAVDAERSKLEQLDSQKRSLEEEITEGKDKVRKWEARLAEQRSTREYSALAREIDIEKKGQQTRTEDAQEFGRQAGIQRELLKAKELDFTTTTQGLVAKLDVLRGKLAEVEAQVKAVDLTRQESAKAVDARLLRQYDVIRKRRTPALVSVVAPGTCGGCRMNIPAQRFNQLVASRGIDTCPACSRMIYAAEVLEEPAAK